MFDKGRNPLKADAQDRLYGDPVPQSLDFRLHCETLYSRSSLHRFEIGLHRHESFLQILYVSDGEGDARLHGQVLAIRPPAAIVVPPGFDHGFRFSTDIGGVILTLLPAALPPSLQPLIRRAQPVLIPLTEMADREPIERTVLRLAEEYAGADMGREPLLDGLLSTLVVLLLRAAAPTGDEPARDAAERRYQALLSLIARHVREQKPAAFYAARLNLSQTHLNRLVKAKCGLSLQRLIAKRQIELAQQELTFTISTVQMVATGLGFTDAAYFSRFFRKETGLTPRAWRLAQYRRLSLVEAPQDAPAPSFPALQGD